MARDFEDINDLDNLSDDELRDLARQHLAANNAIDASEIIVRVAGGRVRLEGRVGTDGERRIAEHVLTDLVGIEAVDNALFVDPIRREESPEAPDDHAANEEKEEGLLLGDMPEQADPEAAHLATDRRDADLFGTTDVGLSTEQGTAWIPPESPTPEGPAGAGEIGENH